MAVAVALGIAATGCGRSASSLSPPATAAPTPTPEQLPGGITTAAANEVISARTDFGLVFNTSDHSLSVTPPTTIAAYSGPRSVWTSLCTAGLEGVDGSELVVVYAAETNGNVVAFVTGGAYPSANTDMRRLVAAYEAPAGSPVSATAWCTNSVYVALQ